ncbi:hypothetical protein D3C78_1854050 [compost metagenome]
MFGYHMVVLVVIPCRRIKGGASIGPQVVTRVRPKRVGTSWIWYATGQSDIAWS